MDLTLERALVGSPSILFAASEPVRDKMEGEKRGDIQFYGTTAEIKDCKDTLNLIVKQIFENR